MMGYERRAASAHQLIAAAFRKLQRTYHLRKAGRRLLFCHKQGELSDKLSSEQQSDLKKTAWDRLPGSDEP
jgi:hypothetical protein